MRERKAPTPREVARKRRGGKATKALMMKKFGGSGIRVKVDERNSQ